MTTLWQDIRYGFRILARNPGFTTTAVLVLALGIGANTAIFSVVNAVLLKPLPYKDPDRIVTLWEHKREEGIEEMATSHRNFTQWREQNRVFELLAAWQNRSFYFTGADEPLQIRAMAASSCLFSLLGTRPLLGRGFLSEEERLGKDRVVVLSYAFWRDHLGAASDAVGKTIRLENDSYTVIGIMPPDFQFPIRRSAPLWVPLVLKTGTEALRSRELASVARLKEGVSLKQARAEMVVIAERLEQVDPGRNAGFGISVNLLLDEAVKENRKWLFLLLGAVGFMLLIACGNVANLFLARAIVQQREIAVRIALGAHRGRIMRQVLTESLILSMAAGLTALLVTLCMIKGLVSLCPDDIPRIGETRLDASVFAFTLSLSALTGLAFGLVPALKASDVHLSHALKEGLPRSTTGRELRHFHAGLVVVQIGIALTLLIGSTLLIRSLIALQQVDLGFRPENLLAMEIQLPRTKYAESHQCKDFFETLLQRIRAFSDVRSAALVSGRFRLGSSGGYSPFSVDGRAMENSDERPRAKGEFVSPGFFETMGITILKGRGFKDPDMHSDEGSVIIDENLARNFFADIDPIGQRINGMPVVGVVRMTKDFEVLIPVHNTLYSPLGEFYFQLMTVVVRTDGDPLRLASVLRAQVSAVDPEQPVSQLRSMKQTLTGIMAPRRFSTLLLGLFAGVALILAAVGIYGLLQYTARQQTHEIGIRMALGARGRDVLKDILGQGLKLTLVGVGIGLAGAFALTRLLSSFLYDVSPMDPVTFVGVSLFLAGVAMVASYIPARRATKIDPMVALRWE